MERKKKKKIDGKVSYPKQNDMIIEPVIYAQYLIKIAEFKFSLKVNITNCIKSFCYTFLYLALFGCV